MIYSSSVSVIIPCYNQGVFLLDALESISRQKIKSIEVIIIDDGSTDSTSINQIINLKSKSWNFSLKTFFQENSGVSGARNKGLREARGEFIQFLDADDILEPDKFEVQLKILAEDKNIDISICEYFVCDINLGNKYMPEKSTIDNFDFSAITFIRKWERGLSIPIHCALFRSSVLDRIEFVGKFRAHEDIVFWFDLSKKIGGERFHYLNRALVSYRVYAESKCRNTDQMAKAWLRVNSFLLAKEFAFLNSNISGGISQFQTEYLDHFEKVYLQGIINKYIEIKPKGIIRKILSKVWRLWKSL